MSNTNEQRLPTHVTPLEYHITLEPNLDEFTFTGEMSCKLQVNTAALTDIVFHAADLSLAEVSVVGTDPDQVFESTTDILEDQERVRVHVVSTGAQTVAKGDHVTLRVKYAGELNDRLIGFYRSSYKSRTGEPRIMATTQFEACDARRAFPCWDEPAIRAPFNITLVVPTHLVALSNMNIRRTEHIVVGDDRVVKKKVSFYPTPPTSSYIVAFAVAELEYVTKVGPRGIPVSVYATPGNGDKIEFACDVAIKCLEQLESLFGVNYPLPKLDLIAVPDFSIGAMENWGLVTFRESALLIDSKLSGVYMKERVAGIVAHELSHMWFGNLVSIEWWSQLWLKEGFATYFGWFVVDAVFPEWGIWEMYIADITGSALSLDALKSSHPVEVDCKSEAQINEAFDTISYRKGASILRMLAAYLGKDRLTAGLCAYVQEYQYKSASTEMLWKSLAKATGEPVTTIMPCWTEQVGYPLLRAHMEPDSTTKLHVEQQKYYLSTTDPDEPSSQALWNVPILLTGGNKPFLMKKQSETFTVPTTSKPYLMLNNDRGGFYRVLYSRSMMDDILANIATLNVSELNRITFMQDSFHLCVYGHLGLDVLLGMFESYKMETNGRVWGVMLDALQQVRAKFVEGPEATEKWNAWVLETLLVDGFERMFQSSQTLCFDEDAMAAMDPDTVSLYARIVGELAKCGHTETVAWLQGLFSAYNESPVPAALMQLVLNVGVANGGEEAYEFVMDLYANTNLTEAKLRCAVALGAAKSETLRERTLVFSISPDVRAQDATIVFRGVCGKGAAVDHAWKFFCDNWAVIDERYGKGGSKLLPAFVGACGANMHTMAQCAQLEAFFEEHDAPSAAATIKQVVEKITITSKWIEAESGKFDAFFAK